jgi:hypothetical protein
MNFSIRKTLDRAAVSMAVVCGIHCLVTPVLLAALPLLATTLWVDKNFHLWMLLLVLPTTTIAVWSGCRRHKDKCVVASATLGIAILATALISERLERSQADDALPVSSGGEVGPRVAAGGCCELHMVHLEASDRMEGAESNAGFMSWHALLNTLGGCFIVAGHTRNFLLCRASDCSHGDDCCET